MYLLDSLKNVDIAVLNTAPIYQGSIKDNPPIHLDTINLRAYFELKLIDSIDINFIYNQIDSSSYVMNPNKLKIRTFSYENLTKMATKSSSSDIYDILKKTFDASNYIEISTPLYSKDGDTIILYLGIHRGKLSGQGLQLFFKKINSKWILIRDVGTWKS